MRFLLGNRKGERRKKSIHCSLEKKRKSRRELRRQRREEHLRGFETSLKGALMAEGGCKLLTVRFSGHKFLCTYRLRGHEILGTGFS